MEDKWIVVDGLLGPGSWWAGVFDGHGGGPCCRPTAFLCGRGSTAHQCALTRGCTLLGSEASAILHVELHKGVASLLAPTSLDDAAVRQGLSASFLATDAALLKVEKKAGSTATTVLKVGQRLYCANVGDSRTVLCRGVRGTQNAWAQPVTAHPMSDDQKPSRADEKARIKERGGIVQKGRLMVRPAANHELLCAVHMS